MVKDIEEQIKKIVKMDAFEYLRYKNGEDEFRPDVIPLVNGIPLSFVEVKNSSVASCSKVPHSSYIGDSNIGSNVNIGAGFVTANFDGVNKNKTSIGDGAFIGSNSVLVAPLSIGFNSVVGAGSCITEDVLDDSLSVARSRQVNKNGYYKKNV